MEERKVPMAKIDDFFRASETERIIASVVDGFDEDISKSDLLFRLHEVTVAFKVINSSYDYWERMVQAAIALPKRYIKYILPLVGKYGTDDKKYLFESAFIGDMDIIIEDCPACSDVEYISTRILSFGEPMYPVLLLFTDDINAYYKLFDEYATKIMMFGDYDLYIRERTVNKANIWLMGSSVFKYKKQFSEWYDGRSGFNQGVLFETPELINPYRLRSYFIAAHRYNHVNLYNENNFYKTLYNIIKQNKLGIS